MAPMKVLFLSKYAVKFPFSF